MKPQKTMELSVGIAEPEGSPAEEDVKQQAQITPRKRGRPRKIVENTESEDQTKEAKITQEEEVEQKPLAKAEASSMPPRRRSRRKSKPRKSS